MLSLPSAPAMGGGGGGTQGRAGGQDGRAPAVPRPQSPLDAALGPALCANPSPTASALATRSSLETVRLEQAYSVPHRRSGIVPSSFLAFPKPLLAPGAGFVLAGPIPAAGRETPGDVQLVPEVWWHFQLERESDMRGDRERFW